MLGVRMFKDIVDAFLKYPANHQPVMDGSRFAKPFIFKRCFDNTSFMDFIEFLFNKIAKRILFYPIDVEIVGQETNDFNRLVGQLTNVGLTVCVRTGAGGSDLGKHMTYVVEKYMPKRHQ